MIFLKNECDILTAMNSDLLYVIYMLGKRGVNGFRYGNVESWDGRCLQTR